MIRRNQHTDFERAVRIHMPVLAGEPANRDKSTDISPQKSTVINIMPTPNPTTTLDAFPNAIQRLALGLTTQADK
jgi:hypothetical protein